MNFELIAGEDGQSLFPDADVTEESPSEFSLSYIIYDDENVVRANLSAWGLVSASADASSKQRYAVYRAYHITRVLEIDDATEIRDPPPTARYYIHRIYFGHVYETVFHGAESEFHAGIAAQFKGVGGSIDGFAKEHHLETEVFAVGLKPKEGTALFAKTPAEVEKYYEVDYEHPSPIFVEYRSIPTREAPKPALIEFAPPPAFESGTYIVTVDSGKVAETTAAGDSWDGFLGRYRPDPRVTVYSGTCRDAVFSTGTQSNTYQPEWGDYAKVDLNADSRLCFTMWDVEGLGSDTEIGTCETEKLAEQPMNGNKIVLRGCKQVEELVVTLSKHSD